MLSHTVDLSPDDAQRLKARRSARFEARAWLWAHTALKRIRSCGRGTRSDAEVSVKVTTHEDGRRTAGYGGVQSCGSVWACPWCSAKIANQRQQELAECIEAWHKRGGRVALFTGTMRHKRGQRLSTLWEALSGAWHATATGAGWKAEQVAMGTLLERTVQSGARKGQTVVDWRIPTVRVVEATVGDNGWHLHIHSLLFLAGDVTEANVQALGGAMFGRWSAHLTGKGLRPSRAHGVDIRLIGSEAGDPLSEYFTKAVYSASMEAARGDLKESRAGNRTPFAVLADLVAVYRDGGAMPDRATAEDEDIWAEWERASRGRRQITGLTALRKFLGLGEVLTDEEVADQADLDGDVVAVLDRPTWRQIVAEDAQLRVLLAFESSDHEGRSFLQRFWAASARDERERAGVRGRARFKRLRSGRD